MNALSLTDLNSSIDGEPRMLDLKLAEALEFARPRDIRKIIERNAMELQSFGSLRHVAQTPGALGGRPSKAYYLSKKQALYITAKSETPVAALITIQMVEVFDAWTSAHQPSGLIPVQAHERRPSTSMPTAIKLKTNVDRLERIVNKIVQPAVTLCAMVIDGESVFVDVTAAPQTGDRAVLITHTGEIKIETITGTHDGLDFGLIRSPRSVYGPYRQVARGIRERDTYTFFGKIVVATAQPVRKETPALPANENAQCRGRRAPFKAQIIAMLCEGKGCREIARSTGASYGTVTHWKRCIEDGIAA